MYLTIKTSLWYLQTGRLPWIYIYRSTDRQLIQYSYRQREIVYSYSSRHADKKLKSSAEKPKIMTPHAKFRSFSVEGRSRELGISSNHSAYVLKF
jgi:hypothetical protein